MEREEDNPHIGSTAAQAGGWGQTSGLTAGPPINKSLTGGSKKRQPWTSVTPPLTVKWGQIPGRTEGPTSKESPVGPAQGEHCAVRCDSSPANRLRVWPKAAKTGPLQQRDQTLPTQAEGHCRCLEGKHGSSTTVGHTQHRRHLTCQVLVNGGPCTVSPTE